MSAAITLPSNPDSLWKILPPSATQLERDLLTITSTDDLRHLFALISKVKRQIEPANWLPLLLAEYGFSEVAKEYSNWRHLLSVAKALRGKWGTPLSIKKMAALMAYYNAKVWEEPLPSVHFPEFQLELGAFEADLSRLGRLRRMANIVKPARGRFRRIFNGWDERQALWDESDWGCFLDNDSGVDILPLGFFGTYRGDDQFIVSLGIHPGNGGFTASPFLLLLSPELALFERDYGSLVSEEFLPLLDEEGWDDDFGVYLVSQVTVQDPISLIWVTEDGTILVDQNGVPLLLS